MDLSFLEGNKFSSIRFYIKIKFDKRKLQSESLNVKIFKFKFALTNGCRRSFTFTLNFTFPHIHIERRKLSIQARRITRRWKHLPSPAASAASWRWSSSYPCSVCSETRPWWRADWGPSSRRAAPSSGRPAADSPRNRCAACGAASRWGRCARGSACRRNRRPCGRDRRAARLLSCASRSPSPSLRVTWCVVSLIYSFVGVIYKVFRIRKNCLCSCCYMPWCSLKYGNMYVLNMQYL